MAIDYGRWCRLFFWIIVLSVFWQTGCVQLLLAQESSSSRAGQADSTPPVMTSPQTAQMEKRLEEVSDLLLQTRRQLEQSREQMNALTAEIEAMRRQMAAAPPAEAAANALAETVARQADELEVQQAEIHQHEQTKVETTSKYALRLHGLVLFNAFSNSGAVDNIDLPSIALPVQPGASHGTIGATMRQTILGLHGTGPEVFGARTSADVNTDFFSDVSYSYYGNSIGNLRMRQADVGLDWQRDSLHLGLDEPLISPNSPDSYATVGIPSLGWSGNLWTWSTQLRYKHTLEWGARNALDLEGGLWDAPIVGLNIVVPSPLPSPGDLSRRPGLEGRVAYRGGEEDNPLVLGIGGYSGWETYSGNTNIHTWAVTGDWKIPLTHWFEVTGEIYRGVGLGGFGGGAYKDVLSGMNPVTDSPMTIGLDAVGGWSQLKAKILPSLQANAAYGQDGGFAGDFRELELYGSTYPLEMSARNSMVFANLVYRPKTYLILSPEYRRIMSWQITGAPHVANVVTVSAGYQF